MVMKMVDVRCKDFDDTIWAYVVENARVRNLSRCETLQQIVLEHMKFMYQEQKDRVEL